MIGKLKAGLIVGLIVFLLFCATPSSNSNAATPNA
jgi:hypothetical protein